MSSAEYRINCCGTPLHKNSGKRLEQMSANEQTTDCEDLRDTRKRKRGKKKPKPKTRSDLWVSFQHSHLAALSWLEHKLWERCGTQKHNSGFPPLCNDWWNNVWREQPFLSCRFLPLYCNSCHFCPRSLICFLTCVFLPVTRPFFLPLTLHHSLLLRSVESMPFRGQMSQREVFHHSPSHFFFQAWNAFILISSIACAGLNFSAAMDSFPKSHRLVWDVLIIFLIYFALFHLDNITFSLYCGYLYHWVFLCPIYSRSLHFPIPLPTFELFWIMSSPWILFSNVVWKKIYNCSV